MRNWQTQENDAIASERLVKYIMKRARISSPKEYSQSVRASSRLLYQM